MLMKELRGVGRYQWICILLYGLTAGTNVQMNSAILFTAPNEVDFYCNDPSVTFATLSQERQKELMVTFGRCNRPDMNFSLYTSQELESMNGSNINQSRTCDTGFVYDHTYMDYTVTEQFDLVCDRKWIVSMSKTVYMVGYLFGALGFGTLSDRFGRKRTMVILVLGAVVLNIALAFPPNAELFLLARGLLGAAYIGIFTIGLILHTELVRMEERKLPSTVISFSHDIVVLIFVAVTVGLRDYRHLQLYIAASIAVSSGLLLLVAPESPRWLVSQNRREEARRICKRIARFNSWSEDKLDHLMQSNEDNEQKQKANLTHLLRTPVLRKRTILLCVIWFCHVMTFYALMFNMGIFYADVRTGLVISNLIELPSTLIPMLLIDRIGRQLSTSIFAGVGALACMAMGPIILIQGASTQGSPLMLGMAVLGKLMITRLFYVTYIYTQELFPTVVRSQGLGLTSTFSRLGGMLAPQIILLDDLWPATSSFVLGSAALFAAVLVFAIPDTTGQELPQTITDGEQFKNKHVFRPDWPRKRRRKKHGEETGEVGEELNQVES